MLLFGHRAAPTGLVGVLWSVLILAGACSNRVTTTVAFSSSCRWSTRRNSATATQLHVASNYAPWTKASFKQQPPPSIQLNFNDPGESPFGFDLTAEIWNGRFAQIGVVWVACQELIQGRGILQSFNQEFNVLALLAFLGLISAMSLQLLYDWYFPYSLSTTEQKPPSPTSSSKADSDGLWGYAATKVNGNGNVATLKQPKRLWNLNNVEESPYGVGRNAEMWNGRIAMLSFVWIIVQETIEKRGVIPGILKGNPADFGSFAAFCLGLFSFVGFLDYASSEEEERLLTSMKAKKDILARRILDFSAPPVAPPQDIMSDEAPFADTTWNAAVQPAVSYAPVNNKYHSQRTTSAHPVAASGPPPPEIAEKPASSYESASAGNGASEQPTSTTPAFSYRPATQPQQPIKPVGARAVQQRRSYSAPLPAAAAAVLASSSGRAAVPSRSPFPGPEPFRFKSEVQEIAQADTTANRPPRTKEFDPTPIRTNPPPPRPATTAATSATTGAKRSYAVSQSSSFARGRTPGGNYLESLSP